MTTEEIKKILEAELDKKRFTHSIGTAETAVKLAKKFDIDPVRIEIAGLLHDCAKGMSVDNQIDFAYKHSIELDPWLLKNPGIIHTKIGAYLAVHKYGIPENDGEILNSIIYHTTGFADMGMFEKIIYVADYIEPNRDYSKREKFYKSAFDTFEEAVLKITVNKMKYVIKKKTILHPWSIEFYNSLVEARQFSPI
jgi:predicted HD superfamily hydrolase involved in NAD metabolism